MTSVRAIASLLVFMAPALCVPAMSQTVDVLSDARPPGRAFLPDVPLADLKATRERPLFVPSRRPRPAVVPQPPLTVAPPPLHVEAPLQLTLLGIIRAPQGARSAVVMDETNHTSYSLKAGDNRRGWIVTSIDADAVTLQMQDRSARLTYQRAAPMMPVSQSKNLPAN